ncbi:MAG TPA: PDZ domain-containing protein [Candidatus Parcubacteria bacterium]|nr:PDZ domain-containing protein [Candidatus Parcubacteria bacterium]
MALSIIIAVLILSFLVILHEFGHFIAAKKLGVRVEEFGIGYPPKIFGVKKGETIYSINLIPFGGFVRLYGEEGEEESGSEEIVDKGRSFNAKSVGARSLILLAGVIMNFLLAAVIFYFLLFSNGFTDYQYLIFSNYRFPFGHQRDLPAVSFVAKNSPAEKSGLHSKDIILSVNGIRFEEAGDFVGFVKTHKGEKLTLKVKDLESGEVKNIDVVPRLNPPKNEGPLGVGLLTMAELKYENPLEKLFAGVLHSLNLSHYSVVSIGELIKTSFKEKSVEPLSSSVVGPVGILVITKITLKQGIIALLNLVALISLALVVVNIIPFPALDGGRLVFVLVEGILRRKIPQSIERNVNFAGFIILVLLLVLVTIKDVSQFRGFF